MDENSLMSSGVRNGTAEIILRKLSIHQSAPLFHLCNLQDICWDMQVNRNTACIYDHVAGFYETSFFQDLDLVENNIINAHFLIVKKSANAPTETQLIYQGSFLGKNIKGCFWTIAT